MPIARHPIILQINVGIGKTWFVADNATEIIYRNIHPVPPPKNIAKKSFIFYLRKGLFLFSFRIVVFSPWPGYTTTESGRVIIFIFNE